MLAEPRNLTRSAMRGASWLGASSLLRLALRIASVAILARLVSPADYGIATAALVVFEFALMIADLGLSPALAQRPEVQDRHVATAFGAAFVILALLVVGMWFASPLFAYLLNVEQLEPISRVLTIMVAFRVLGAQFEALLMRHMRMERIATISLVSWALAIFVVGIPFAVAGGGYWALISMNIAEAAFTSILLGYAARDYLVYPRLDLRSLRDLLPLSVGFAVYSPLGFLSENIDRFMLARILGTADLGLFSRATFLAKTAATMFGNITRIASFSTVSRVQTDPERLRTSTRNGLALTALLSLPAGVTCMVFANELVSVLLGSQWKTAAIPFAVFGAALYPILGLRFLRSIYKAIGRPYMLVPMEIINVTALALSIYLMAPYGLTPICIGIAAVMVLRFAMIGRAACRMVGLGFPEYVRLHVAPINFAIGLGLIGVLVKYVLGDASAFVTLAVFGAISGFVLVGLMAVQPSLVVGEVGLKIVNRMFGPKIALFGFRGSSSLVPRN